MIKTRPQAHGQPAPVVEPSRRRSGQDKFWLILDKVAPTNKINPQLPFETALLVSLAPEMGGMASLFCAPDGIADRFSIKESTNSK
jgi:hypothetical protein